MLVEDEENLHLAIKLNLELENYNVTSSKKLKEYPLSIESMDINDIKQN